MKTMFDHATTPAARRTMGRNVLAGLGIASAGVLLVGCTTNVNTAPADSEKPTETTVVTETATASEQPESSEAAPAQTGGNCDVKVTIAPENGAAGSSYYSVSFENTGSEACELPEGLALTFTGADGQDASVWTEERPYTLEAGHVYEQELKIASAGALGCEPMKDPEIKVGPEQVGEASVDLKGDAKFEVCAGKAEDQLSMTFPGK